MPGALQAFAALCSWKGINQVHYVYGQATLCLLKNIWAILSHTLIKCFRLRQWLQQENFVPVKP